MSKNKMKIGVSPPARIRRTPDVVQIALPDSPPLPLARLYMAGASEGTGGRQILEVGASYIDAPRLTTVYIFGHHEPRLWFACECDGEKISFVGIHDSRNSPEVFLELKEESPWSVQSGCLRFDNRLAARVANVLKSIGV